MKLIDDLSVNINKISEWCDNYYDWLDFNTRSVEPMARNLDNLTKAQYHYELGRNGYFTPESGTSEGQFLSALGYIHMYEATHQMKWLGLAEKNIDAALVNMYKGETFPTEDFNEFNAYIPHWLFCASKPFTSERYYLNKQFNFLNGTATFTTDYEARKVFQVISADGVAEWDDPNATFTGTAYTVVSYTAVNKTMTVKIQENYTGSLIVVYSDLGGDTIEVLQNYEAYPIWRKLLTGEIDAACDSLFWSYHCWVKLYEITKNKRYDTLIKHTQDVIKYACSISDANDYITTAFDTTLVLNVSGMYIDDSNRSPVVTWLRNALDGSIEIDVTKGQGLFGIGTGILLDTDLIGRYYEVCVTTDLPTPINLGIYCEDSVQMTGNYYELWQWTTGTGKPEKLKFYFIYFSNTSNVLFDLQYSPHEELMYLSANSSYTWATEIYDGCLVRIVNFALSTEYDVNNNAFSGWCQYQPTLQTQYIDDIPDITYQSTGCIEMTFLDSEGWLWVTDLPKQNQMSTVSIRKADFKLHEKQPNASTDYPTAPIGQLSTLLFAAFSHTAQLKLLRIGNISDQSTTITGVNRIQLNINKDDAQTIKLHYVRPLPLLDYDYTPYVMPFTFNTINGILNSWRGTPYAGYQSPWFWQDLNDSIGVQTNLQFMKDAQEAYFTSTNNELKFFMPAFIWNRWDSLKYGNPNTFSWSGADPNTSWGGYQYRAIETVAYTLYRDNTLTLAARIVYDFLMSVNRIWDNGQPPANFNSDGTVTDADGIDINGVALIIRTCIYALESEAVSEGLCRTLLNKCLTYVNSLYVVPTVKTDFTQTSTVGTWRSDGIWYQFHGGEMLYTLALLMEFTGNTVNIQSSIGTEIINTIPKNFRDTTKEYVSIQTPSGTQYALLVSKTDSNATNILVQTSSGVQAISKGVVVTGSYKSRLLAQNVSNSMIDATINADLSTLYKAQLGIISISSIKGSKPLTNISPRESYDYTTGLYNNAYYLQPNETYTICATFAGTGAVSFVIVENLTDGTQTTTLDINKRNPVCNDTKIHYTFKTSSNHSFVTIYPPNNETTMSMNNIMIFNDIVGNVPSYFPSTSYSFTEDIVFSTKYPGTLNSDSYHLIDYIPSEYLPLRYNDGVYDEITNGQIIKRVASDGTTLLTPLTYPLSSALPIFNCGKNAWVTLISDGVLPYVDILYPVLSVDSIDITNNNITVVTNSAKCGEFELGNSTVKSG